MADEAWNEYRLLVLAELKRLKESIDAVSVQIGKLQSDVAVLQFKAGVWGALAGSVPGAIAAIWFALKS